MARTKRFGTTTCVILAGLAAYGCSSSTTSSGGSSSGGTSGGAGSGDGGAASNVVNVNEVEPNNGPDMAGAQDLGTLNDSETLVITGQLSSGGWDGTKYTGDWDLFTFDAAAVGALDVKVDWTSGADVDVALYDANLQQITGDGTQAKPAALKTPSASGKLLVALYSKDQAAPYTLTIAYTKSGGGTGNGTCPTTPIVAANHTGGCNIDTTTPVCAVADLRNGRARALCERAPVRRRCCRSRASGGPRRRAPSRWSDRAATRGRVTLAPQPSRRRPPSAPD